MMDPNTIATIAHVANMAVVLPMVAVSLTAICMAAFLALVALLGSH